MKLELGGVKMLSKRNRNSKQRKKAEHKKATQTRSIKKLLGGKK